MESSSLPCLVSASSLSRKGGSPPMPQFSYRFKHLHCTENTIYVFPEMKLSGLSPNSFLSFFTYFYSQGLELFFTHFLKYTIQYSPNSCIQVSVNDLRVYIPTNRSAYSSAGK
jgi:hypothetical protein